MHYFWPWPYITANESTWIQSCGQWMKVTQSMCISEWVCVWGVCYRGQITYVECLCELPPWWRADTAYLSLTQADLHTEPGISDPDGQEASQPLSSNTLICTHAYTFISLTTVHRLNFSGFSPSSASPFEPSLFLFLDNLAEPWASIQALLKQTEKNNRNDDHN